MVAVPHDFDIASWGSFFATTAQVSGGFLGLVFVALTFRPEMVGSTGNVALRRLAEQVFSDFLSVLSVSLTMLIPHSSWPNAIVVAGFGAAGVWNVVRNYLAARKTEPAARKDVGKRLVVSLIANLGLVAAGGAAFGLLSVSTFWTLVLATIFILTIAGGRTAWFLVTRMAG